MIPAAPPPSTAPAPEPAPQPPATPAGLHVSASGADFIEWAWSPVADADGYEVQFSLDAEFTAEDEVVVRTAAETSYRRSSMPPETAGFLQVRSLRGTGEAQLRSAWSPSVTGMTGPPPEPPATPTGLQVSASGADFIEWAWSPVADADGYEVQFSLDAEFTAGDEIVFRTSAETSYRRSSLSAETVGFLRVRSIRGMGEARLWSQWSPPATWMTAGNDGMTALAKVTVLPVADILRRPANFFDLEGRTVTFTPDGEGRYEVQTSSLTWVETGAATGPVFDLSGGGWRGESTRISLPFGFPFVGRNWTRVHVNTNGNVSFTAPETTHSEQRDLWSNATMRSVAAAVDSRSSAGLEAMIAVLWALYGETAVSVAASPARVAITWDAVRIVPRNHYYEPAGPNEFQVRLYPSGVIEFAYRKVSERDGIVGLFHGAGARGEVLGAATDDTGDVSTASIDIVSGELVDHGSTVIASVTMADDIPDRVSSGQLSYRFHLGGFGGPCAVGLTVGATGRRPDGCGPDPGTVGYTVQGRTLEIPISKALWPEDRALSWTVDAVWWGRDEWDHLYGEPVTVDASDHNLSSLTGTVAGNVFEVFHYPSVTQESREVSSSIYGRAPAEDELTAVFTDFRFDDLFNTGPATGPVNVSAQGIGWDKPQDGSDYGSDSLLSALAGSRYIGGPRYAEFGVEDDYEFHGHSYGVRHVAHELIHRWTARLRFRDPVSGRVEDLADSGSHWKKWVHVPERYPIWSGFAEEPYSTGSIMGGRVWQDNGDGTFTELDTGYPRAMGLSDLDLYAMGMIPPEEVRPTFLLRDAVETGTRGVFRATKVPVRIEDIVAAMGPRVPSASEERKVFRLGVYLLHEDGRPPRAEWLERAHNLTEDVVNYFSLATGGRPVAPAALWSLKPGGAAAHVDCTHSLWRE